MFGSILVKMPVITRESDDEIGVEVINKYFVRLKGDVYIPLFNLPLLYPKVFHEEEGYKRVLELASITFEYYKEYLELRKQKQFKVKVFLPEKYGGNALYYLLQKFMIGEATTKEIKIISEFLSRDVFDGRRVRMKDLLQEYYLSIWRHNKHEEVISINTPIGVTPLYVSEDFLHQSRRILMTVFGYYHIVAFVNVLTSHFFGKSIQIGSTRFNLLKSIGELDFNWNNVKVISFRELYDISDAIIENNLEMTFPKTSYDMSLDIFLGKNVFLSHSPILSAVGNAIDFKNKSVMLLFAMLRRDVGIKVLTNLNNLFYLNNKNVEFLVTKVPFKNIKKFIYRVGVNTGIFIIEQDGKTIPVLSTDVDQNWVGVGRENIVRHYTNYSWWHDLLVGLASPENLRKAEEKTQEWLKNSGPCCCEDL